MPQVWVGLTVQTPMNPSDNNGHDKAPAVVTFVGGAGMSGGVIVNIRVLTDGVLITNIVSELSVEFVDYEETARALGIGNGAWPLDYA